MQVKKVKISQLTGAAHNPEVRTDKKDPKFRQLERSIENVGLIYPVVVAKDMTIIDGHRRVAVATHMGWEEIPIIVVEADDKDAIYAEVNANSLKLTGSQNLSVWLKNPKAVTSRAATKFASWEAVVGRSILQKLAKARMSLEMLHVARSVANYVESEDPAFIVKAVLWLMTHRNTRVVTSYMATQHPAPKLYSAIKANKALRVTYAA